MTDPSTDKLAQIERALSVYWAVDPKWDTNEDVAAKAALETLVEIAKAAQEVSGYGEDLQPVWQLGAGQDWQEWRDAKQRLRAALSALDGDA